MILVEVKKKYVSGKEMVFLPQGSDLCASLFYTPYVVPFTAVIVGSPAPFPDTLDMLYKTYVNIWYHGDILQILNYFVNMHKIENNIYLDI